MLKSNVAYLFYDAISKLCTRTQLVEKEGKIIILYFDSNLLGLILRGACNINKEFNNAMK